MCPYAKDEISDDEEEWNANIGRKHHQHKKNHKHEKNEKNEKNEKKKNSYNSMKNLYSKRVSDSS
jgi:hypothetical protein